MSHQSNDAVVDQIVDRVEVTPVTNKRCFYGCGEFRNGLKVTDGEIVRYVCATCVHYQ